MITWDVDRHILTAHCSLLQVMRSTDYASPNKCTMLCFDWLIFNSCDWRISILAVSVNRSLGGLLLYSSVVVFLDCGHLRRRDQTLHDV